MKVLEEQLTNARQNGFPPSSSSASSQGEPLPSFNTWYSGVGVMPAPPPFPASPPVLAAPTIHPSTSSNRPASISLPHPSYGYLPQLPPAFPPTSHPFFAASNPSLPSNFPSVQPPSAGVCHPMQHPTYNSNWNSIFPIPTDSTSSQGQNRQPNRSGSGHSYSNTSLPSFGGTFGPALGGGQAPSPSTSNLRGSSYSSDSSVSLQGISPAPIGTGLSFDVPTPQFMTPSYLAPVSTSAHVLKENTETPPITEESPQTALEAIEDEEFFTQLVYPGYPERLPRPSVMRNLLETFFAKIPIAHVFHKVISFFCFVPPICQTDVLYESPQTRLLSNFNSLPPTHPSYPHPAILHAICAHVARHSGLPEVGSIPEDLGCGPINTLDPESFEGRHALWAKQELEREYSVGGRLMDVMLGECSDLTSLTFHEVQSLLIKKKQKKTASLILSSFDYCLARWVPFWLSSSMTARMTSPLGLSESSADKVEVPGIKSTVLPEPVDCVDKELRKRAFWYAFLNDRSAYVRFIGGCCLSTNLAKRKEILWLQIYLVWLGKHAR